MPSILFGVYCVNQDLYCICLCLQAATEGPPVPPSPPSAATAAEVAAGLAAGSPLVSAAGARPASQETLLLATPAANTSLGTPPASAPQASAGAPRGAFPNPRPYTGRASAPPSPAAGAPGGASSTPKSYVGSAPADSPSPSELRRRFLGALAAAAGEGAAMEATPEGVRCAKHEVSTLIWSKRCISHCCIP